MLGPGLAALLYAVLLEGVTAARAVYYGSKLLFLLLPAAWLILVAGRPIRLPRPSTAGLTPALLFGLLVAIGIVALYHLHFAGRLNTEGLEAKARVFGATRHYLLYAAFLALANAAYEEYLWRWFVFGRLRELMAVGPAAFLSAVAFGLHHFVVAWAVFGSAPLAALLTAGVVVGGLAWALMYHRWGNLWSVWLSHAVVDAGLLLVGNDLLGSLG